MQRLLRPILISFRVDFSSGSINGKASLNFPTPQPPHFFPPSSSFLLVEFDDEESLDSSRWKLMRSIPREGTSFRNSAVDELSKKNASIVFGFIFLEFRAGSRWI